MSRTNRTLSRVPDDVPVAGLSDLRMGACVTTQRRYRLVEAIAEGGMGVIYRAHDTALSRDVALKVLKPGVPQVSRERFAREARVGASLSHPNLAPIFDRGALPDGGQWLAMELLHGHDLHEVIEAQGRLGVPLLVDVMGQALDVLGYIHAAGLVHRDVKPENLFVVRDPRCDKMTAVKLLDFGIALDLHESGKPGPLAVGDPRYMAPEQTDPGSDVDPRADLYALGVSLYEAATGWHPLRALMSGPMIGLLYAHRQGGFTPPSRHLPGGLPPRFARALDAIVERACAVDPKQRYDNAAQMREEVEALAELARAPGHEPDARGGDRRSLSVAS